MLRNALFAAISFLVLAYFYPGFSFATPNDRIVAALIFALFFLFLRPVIKLLSLPLNLITFGLFSVFINVILLYLITAVLGGFEIIAWRFNGAIVAGASLPAVELSSLLSAIVASVGQSFLSSLLFWIFA